jgi:hypothetical protein
MLPTGGNYAETALLRLKRGAEFADRALRTKFDLSGPLLELGVLGLLGVQAHCFGLVADVFDLVDVAAGGQRLARLVVFDEDAHAHAFHRSKRAKARRTASSLINSQL